MKRISHRTLVQCLLVFAFMLAACGGAATQALPEEPIHLVVTTRENLSWAPFYIAQAEGYFEEQGLDVEFIPSLRSAEALAAMRNGSLDVHASLPSPGLFNAIVLGEPVKIVADRGILAAGDCSYMAVMVRTELVESGEVSGVEDLAGKSVSGALDGLFGFFLDSALQEVGLSIDDIVPMDLPTATEIDALTDGDLDATLQTEPTITTFKQDGIAVELIGAQEVLPGFSWGTVVFGPKLLEEHPEAGKAFIVAYLKGIRQYQEGKTERNLEILEEVTGLDRATLEATCWPTFSLDGRINPQAMQEFQEWSIARGLLDEIAGVEQYWDPSFVDYANEVLGD